MLGGRVTNAGYRVERLEGGNFDRRWNDKGAQNRAATGWIAFRGEARVNEA